MPGMTLSAKNLGKSTGRKYSDTRDYGNSKKAARRTVRAIEKRVVNAQIAKD